MLTPIKAELSKLAPQIVEALQPPATQGQFDALAKVVNFAFGYVFPPIDHVTQQCADYAKIKPFPLKHADPGIRLEYTFAPQRIPIGDDKGTSLICVDLDPVEGGIVGQVILLDYDFSVALKIADSVKHYIEIFLADLQAGLYHLDEEALTNSEFWMDTDSEIDLGNHSGRYTRDW